MDLGLSLVKEAFNYFWVTFKPLLKMIAFLGGHLTNHKLSLQIKLNLA